MLEELVRAYMQDADNRLAGRYEILRTVNIDGHEVAYIEYSVPLGVSTLGAPRKDRLAERIVKCQCHFTEGVGWKRDAKFGIMDYSSVTCIHRLTAMHLRHMELRLEFVNRYCGGHANSFNPEAHIREIVLDLMEKGRNKEWLEASSGSAFYGGYFTVQTLSAITGIYMGHLWKWLTPLEAQGLFTIDGSIFTEYKAPLSPEWVEYLSIEQDGWVGIAKLPAHNRMPQVWRFVFLDPKGNEIPESTSAPLHHPSIFGPDVEDVDQAKEKIQTMLQSLAAGNAPV